MDLSIADLLKTIILGVVEGLTEWLPVSSTGHMILVDEFIKLDVSKAFMDMFLVVIQLGAIMAVVVLSFEKLNPFSSWKTRQEKHDTVQLWMKVIVACIPAAVIGLLFNKYMEEHFMTAPVVATTLIFYGIMFIIVENYNKHRCPVITDLRRLDYKTALIIGIFQVLSLVPGTSRSGATILGGLLFGAVFMATDYVTSPFTLKGKLIYGVALGVITFAIRYWGSYTEGVSFALLFMNLWVPYINDMTRQTPYGYLKPAKKEAAGK